ncbi:MAG: hypothetical protein HFJ50_02385 [Clostridia bacterium]|jgi:hypothetical protein|nr:hypothetical protein [Clostridia bacterium]
MQTQNSKEETSIKSLYGKVAVQTKEEFLNAQKVEKTGLTSSQANANLKKYRI